MIYLFVLFLVALSCFKRAFSSRSKWELPFAVICRLLTAVTSLAGERVLEFERDIGRTSITKTLGINVSFLYLGQEMHNV